MLANKVTNKIFKMINSKLVIKKKIQKNPKVLKINTFKK